MTKQLSLHTDGALQVGDYKYRPTDVETAGWKLCNGQALNRTTYAGLFAVVGTTFWVGDGTTTFNLPDGRGRAMGVAGTGVTLTARVLGDKVGAETHTLSVTEMPAHTHTVETVQTASQNAFGGGDVRANSTTKTSSSAGGNGAHNNMQPTIFAGHLFIYAGV